MLLSTGDNLGDYRILSPLGQGGMGQVYRAHDKRLMREVAVKILPPSDSADMNRRLRFLQEARAVAAIKHPNIAAVYDIASDRGVDFIVMELIEGTPLDQLLGRPLRLEDALRYAIEIAEALGAAHSAGIAHRDIKPPNIIIDKGGSVKLLDFGLAKTSGQRTSGESTRTMLSLTTDGTIMGTPAYMSPEQARGEPVDARTDIFSFGVVLYEMLCGHKPFQGNSAVDILSSLLKSDPRPLSEARPEIPAELDRIVRRAMRKDVALRYQCIDDTRIDLLEVDSSGAVQRIIDPQRPTGRVWPALCALLITALSISVGMQVFRPESQRALTSLALTTYPGSERSASFSPDGRQIAFAWDGEKRDNFDIYVKLTDFGEPLRVTHDPAPDFFPAWSPDGHWIAFIRLTARQRAAIMLVSPLGGPERRLTEVELPLQVAYVQGVCPPRVSWTPESNSLVIVDRGSPAEPFGLFVLSVDSGEKRRLTMPPSAELIDAGPAVSPDGSAVVFTRTSSNIGVGDLFALSLGPGLVPAGEPKRLTIDNRGNGHPAWTPDGREIIFSSPRAGGFFALWRIPAAGGAEPQRVLSAGEGALFPTLSKQGNRLVYTKYALDSNIWKAATSNGELSQLTGSTRQDVMPRFSPDGMKVAFSSDRSGYFQIWICDSLGANAVQLTSLTGRSFHPSWSPDAKRIAFQSNAEGVDNIYIVSSEGGKPQLLTSTADRGGVWPSFSTDGKWIYYSSVKTGRDEIWRVPSTGGAPVQVTLSGGFLPRLSPDGKYLYYMSLSVTSPLNRMALAGGRPESIVDAVAARGFDITSRGVYFFVPPAATSLRDYYEVNANNRLFFLDLLTKRTRPLADVRLPLQLGLTVSPDGASVLYSQIDQVLEDLILVEDFR